MKKRVKRVKPGQLSLLFSLMIIGVLVLIVLISISDYNKGVDEKLKGELGTGGIFPMDAGTCYSEDDIIMRLSSSTNSHGALWSDTGYTYTICYSTFFGRLYYGTTPHNCISENKVVGLSDITNAHLEIPSLSGYLTNICYGDLICRNVEGACNADERAVVALSSNTNAHASEISDANYPVNICCKVPPAECISDNDCVNLYGSCSKCDTLFGKCVTKPSGTICRAVSDSCDVAETCDGTSFLCPLDSFLPDTIKCQSATDICNSDAYCTGSSAICPANQLKPSSTICRTSLDVCDNPEYCTGLSAICPNDLFKSSTIQCRGALDACDSPAYCSGSSAICPSNPFKPSTIQCRGTLGDCDSSAYCSGSSAICPSNPFKPLTYVCRTALGICDIQETCTGSNIWCPADSKQPNGLTCDDSNICTNNDECTNGICVGTLIVPTPTDCLCTSPSQCPPAIEQCKQATCIGGACDIGNKVNGVSCNDNNACTNTDVCVNGVCSGTTIDCNDNDVCTDDSCSNGVCNHVFNGLISGCQCNNNLDCSDNKICTDDSCNLNTHQCSYVNNANPCNDNNACTDDDVCDSGICSGIPINCNDDDVCTIDSCSNGDCNNVFSNLITGCDCYYDSDCSDINICTTEWCSPSHKCSYINNLNSCNDINACTNNDICTNGACGGTTKICTPGSSCKLSSCDSATGNCLETNKPDTTSCDDNNMCTNNDECTNGACAGIPIVPTPTDCSCINPNQCPPATEQCKQASCIESACGIENKVTGTICNDDNACTDDDVCDSGLCAGTFKTCTPTNDCRLSSCDMSLGNCLETNKDDGTVCTISTISSLSPFLSFLKLFGIDLGITGTETGICNSGTCISSCSQCLSPGIKRCDETISQECGDINSDACLEWIPIVNCSNGCSISNGNCVATPGQNPQNITLVTYSVSSDSATIIWNSDVTSSSLVKYGTNSLNLINYRNYANMVVSHSIILTGLASSTTYYYDITSCDSIGICVTNGTYNFTTNAPPVPPDGGGGGGNGGGGGGCTPNCTGKVCGNNGCGGKCGILNGACPSGQICNSAGKCVQSAIVNLTPVLVVEDKTQSVGKLIEFIISGYDPSGKTLTYSASNLPSGASFDPNTGKFSWTPDIEGEYTINFSVSNGNLVSSKLVKINVTKKEALVPSKAAAIIFWAIVFVLIAAIVIIGALIVLRMRKGSKQNL